MISLNMIKGLLVEQGLFETEADVEQFLQEENIGQSTIIQTLIFDKTVFETAGEAVEWARTHGFGADKIDETDDSFRIRQMDPSEFQPDSFRTIDIRRGVSAVIGRPREIQAEVPFFFGSMRNPEEIKLSADLPHIIEIARVVDGIHPQFGPIILTTKTLESFKKNFDERVVGVDLSIDYDHEQREAAAWVRELFLSEDGQILFGVVRWTPGGAKTLSDREFRYFSPMYSLNWQHPHTQEFHGPTLTGGALVNSPFLKMDAIVGLKMKNSEGNAMETIKLDDHNSKVLKLNEDLQGAQLSLSTLQKESKLAIDGLKSDNINLSSKVTELESAAKKRDQDQVHEKLFRENKINKAQLTALKDGKSMLEILALSEKMNTNPQGGDGSVDKDFILSADEKKMCKTLSLTEEEYIKYNTNIDEGGR